MQPVQFEVGTDVYRAATVRGPYPPFDSAWGAVSRALGLFRASLPTLAKTTLPVVIASELLVEIVTFLPRHHGYAALGMLGMHVVDALVNTWLAVATLHVAWAQIEGRRVMPAEARRVGFALFGRMLGARFSYGLRVFIGYCLMCVPALYWLGQYALVEPAVYFEHGSAGASLDRSAQLTKGSIWRVLGTLLLSLAILAAFVAPALLIRSALDRSPLLIAVFPLARLAFSAFAAYGSMLRLVIYLGLAGEVPARRAA